MFESCPKDCPCWGSFTLCAPDCEDYHARKDEEQEMIEDSILEQEWFIKSKFFDDIESEICDFYDALAHVFGGHIWFDPYGDSHYCDGNICQDCLVDKYCEPLGTKSDRERNHLDDAIYHAFNDFYQK